MVSSIWAIVSRSRALLRMVLRERFSHGLAALAALLVAACGGGGGESEQSQAPVQREAASDFTPPLPIPADAHLKGMWSPVYNWPVITVHAVLLPDGRVLSYGTRPSGQQTGYFEYDLWDGVGAPDSGHRTLANSTNTDLFCSSQLVLPTSGNVFIAGGDNWTGTGTTNTGNNNSNLLDLALVDNPDAAQAGRALKRGINMNRPRWYSSSITLMHGETYVQGGSGGTDRAEIRGLDGVFRLNANTSGLDFMYPRNFVAPDGRVFGYDSAGRMYYVDTAGSGSLSMQGQFGSAYRGNDASAAMFRPGRILQFGGASNGAIVIDIGSGGAPVVTPTQSMSSQRRLVNATILADGQVLATGGSRTWNQLDAVNNIAEIWDPATGLWTQGAVGDRARLYHSNALLLPDGSVLVSGGGAPGPQNNTNAEIYFPPYLFTADGQRAPRPAITLAPTALAIGKTFAIEVANAASISRITLVKTGSATHSWNMEQRFLELTFNASGSSVTVQAPTRAGEAPPGFYQLFVFDQAGVPSTSHMLRIGIADDPNPATVPTLAQPGNQSGVVGAAANLQLVASDPNGDALRYSASGLPPGLAIDASTGLISGTPSEAGSYDVVVTVSDGINAASAGFVWTVTGAAPLAFAALPVPAPAPTDGAVNYSASATGSGVEYMWNFGDGAETAWSSTPTASHVYASAGSFVVTISARDSTSASISRSFLQLVHLPSTAASPSISTNVLVATPPGGGNARLWVVNQDNDSVSAFDAVTRAKLGETIVGAAPRAIAVAANGALWVSNKAAASISVIDPSTRAVTRTITLPRASMPFGIAMAPTGNVAYVVLEATGQLLKFDSASYAQLGAVAVGAHARHASVTADGQRAYVSRFISPPLPGEGTAMVAPTTATGGEVVVVNTAQMAVASTVVLRHSDKDDFENQGRGVPNYLGAAAISPDGTQAWVPSKQDNVGRGVRRHDDGMALNFQNTVRAISSRIVLGSNAAEDYARRIDHDNSSVASAAVYDRLGVYLFVALETSREIAVLNAHTGSELLRVDTGRAPQGLALSPDGKTLYVNNFMDRTVGMYDLRPLVEQGEANLPALATLSSVATERLAANVLLGKKLFYDARDTRLALHNYMSCASCHNDGGHDGRVWDLSNVGEGLRNTISLRGRAGAQGRLHWSHNFDEVQDFEGQIRTLAGGTGLMSDAAFSAGTRSQPLGDPKAGLSSDLDALAAYVGSLAAFDRSPHRDASGALTAAGAAGRTVFQQRNCAACHGGSAFTLSGSVPPPDIGTIKPTSGQRLGAALTGIDIPTLRDVWATAPYLHDGSAPTLEAALAAHGGIALSAAEQGSLANYLREIGSDESSAPVPAGTGSGLTGHYFANRTLAGTPVLTRIEVVDFNWGSGSPAAAVPSNDFSVRWSGRVQATASGTYTFQTRSDDGVRLWVNGVQIINNWTNHAATNNTSVGVSLTAGQSVTITLEYYERGGKAEMQLRWRPPGTSSHVTIPRAQLYPN